MDRNLSKMKEITIKELCELTDHINRKARAVLEEYTGISEDMIYSDISSQAKRESGAYNLESIESQYLYAVHEAIDLYTVPRYLQDRAERSKQ